ncbi:MAG: hypothetical protein AAGL66_13225, partial [Pseudomonadota bacterium]
VSTQNLDYLSGGIQNDWQTKLDGYCERLTPDFWAEPGNALSKRFIFLPSVNGFTNLPEGRPQVDT